MLVTVGICYQKYLATSSDKITEVLDSVDDHSTLRFSPMMEGGIAAKYAELVVTRRWAKSDGGHGGQVVQKIWHHI